jgi:hypothetical protein
VPHQYIDRQTSARRLDSAATPVHHARVEQADRDEIILGRTADLETSTRIPRSRSRRAPLLLLAALCACSGGGGSLGGSPDAEPTSDEGAPDAGAVRDGATPSDAGPKRDSGPREGGNDAEDAGSLQGLTAVAVVSGGVVASSTNYQIVTTTGQAPGGNATLSSPSFKAMNGVVGATQGN